MTMALSKRLQTIASYIPKGSRVADIGTDHAYLPIYLVQASISPFVVAGEVNPGPLKSAKDQVEAYQLASFIHVRKGDGLAVVKSGEVDVVTIAGMGGALICDILDRGGRQLKGVRRLVLQPNVAEKQVRKWLFSHGWSLTAEAILEEDGKIYEILVAEPGDPQKAYGKNRPLDVQMTFGPLLLAEGSEEFQKKWRREWRKKRRVAESLSRSSREEAKRKLDEVQKEIKMIEEVVSIVC